MLSDLEKFSKIQSAYVFNPKKWAYDFLKFEPDHWQEEALDDYVERGFLAWSTGSGVGKSCLLAIIVLHFLSTRPFPKVPCTAPSQHQLFDVLWAEISKWLRRSEFLKANFSWTKTKVALIGHEEEWFAVARTSRPRPGAQAAEGLQGFHAEHILFVVDEASGVPDQIMVAVDGALTTKGAHAILASNPTRRSGYFYKATNDERQLENWAVKFVNAEKAKHVNTESIERIARIHGKDSSYYRIKVLGLPPLAESDALLTHEQVYDAHTRGEVEFSDKDEIVLSCDPARFGDDDSVFYLRHGLNFIHRESVHGMDTMQVAKMALHLCEMHSVDKLIIDEIGIGAGVVDGAKEIIRNTKNKRKWPQVIGINVGSKPTEEDKFYNLRAEIFWALRDFIEKVNIPFETEKLDQELTSIKYGWDSKDTKIKLQSKDEIRRELGRSCNDADAFALSLSPLITSLGSYCSPFYFAVGGKQSVGTQRDILHHATKQEHEQESVESMLPFYLIGGKSGGGAFGSRRYNDLRRS